MIRRRDVINGWWREAKERQESETGQCRGNKKRQGGVKNQLEGIKGSGETLKGDPVALKGDGKGLNGEEVKGN